MLKTLNLCSTASASVNYPNTNPLQVLKIAYDFFSRRLFILQEECFANMNCTYIATGQLYN